MSKRNPLHVLRTFLGNPAACRLAWLAIRRYYAVQSLYELTHLLADVAALNPTAIMEIKYHWRHALLLVSPHASRLRIGQLDLPADPNDAHTTAPAPEKLLPRRPESRFSSAKIPTPPPPWRKRKPRLAESASTSSSSMATTPTKA